jgi:hypothetical protein
VTKLRGHQSDDDDGSHPEQLRSDPSRCLNKVFPQRFRLLCETEEVVEIVYCAVDGNAEGDGQGQDAAELHSVAGQVDKTAGAEKRQNIGDHRCRGNPPTAERDKNYQQPRQNGAQKVAVEIGDRAGCLAGDEDGYACDDRVLRTGCIGGGFDAID